MLVAASTHGVTMERAPGTTRSQDSGDGHTPHAHGDHAAGTASRLEPRVIAGSDGGWWLPLTARRATTQPPLNYGQERQDGPGRMEWINALPIAFRAEGLSAVNLARLGERGITHIYVGQARGRVGAPAGPMFDPASLLADPRLKLVYRQDRVLIFEIGTASP